MREIIAGVPKALPAIGGPDSIVAADLKGERERAKGNQDDGPDQKRRPGRVVHAVQSGEIQREGRDHLRRGRLDPVTMKVVTVAFSEGDPDPVVIEEALTGLSMIILYAVSADAALTTREQAGPVIQSNIVVSNRAGCLLGIAYCEIEKESLRGVDPTNRQFSLGCS